MTSKYEVIEAIELINKSFLSFQNTNDNYDLENIFNIKLQILKDLNYYESGLKQKTLTETYRDTFIPGLELIDQGKEIEFYLMFLCSGLSRSKYEFSIHEKYENMYTKFIISKKK